MQGVSLKMDPKHVISALAVLYIEERGGSTRISKDALVEAYRKAGKLTVQILEGSKPSVRVYLEED